MNEGYTKRLSEWAIFKSKLENQNHKPPFFKEGEIWWYHIGENIGVELSGKNEEFTRPVFIFKKYDSYSFLGLPLTAKQKTGSWYVSIIFDNTIQTIILAQSKTIDHRRLQRKICELGEEECKIIAHAYCRLHIKINPPQLPAEVVGQSQIQNNNSTIESTVKLDNVDNEKAPLKDETLRSAFS